MLNRTARSRSGGCAVASATKHLGVLAHDVQHRDCFDSLSAMRDRGGARLIVTSPPYPGTRTADAYGGAEFDTSLEGYRRLGQACFDALVPGGVIVLNLDGPVRVWRKELGETERSLISFKVAIDWAETVGFRYVEHNAYVRWGAPIGHDNNPRWRPGWEPAHVMSRPGAPVCFNRAGATRPSTSAGRVKNRQIGGRHMNGDQRIGKVHTFQQPERRFLTTAEHHEVNRTNRGHPAAFVDTFAEDYVICYSRPGDLVGDPFVGSGTVAEVCDKHGRVFVGGDLGHRKKDGRRWADIVNDKLRPPLFQAALAR